jgi:hypothetical protein
MSLEQAEGFAAALHDPSCAEPDGVSGPRGKGARKRFNVYRNNVVHGLTQAMGSVFPAVKAHCGEARFNDAARLHLAQEPPHSRLVFELGQGFAGFLDAFPPARAQMPWLADLARLERAWLDAWHAADAAPLEGASFAAVPADALHAARFVAHPAARVVASRFAIHALFESGRAGTAFEGDHDTPQPCLVTRPQLSVEVRLLDGAGAAFFQAILEGQTLGGAAAEAFAIDPGFDLAAHLSALLQSGATVAVA